MAQEVVKPSSGNQISVKEEVLYSKALAQSDIIPDSYKNKPANIMVAMEFGRSMGLSPAESLYRINVIKGIPSMSGELVAAQVRLAGHKLRKIAETVNPPSVTVEIVRRDDPKYPTRVTRDQAWAQSMELTKKDNYKKQPLTMLYWRAVTAAAREACPECLYGVKYTPDEVMDFVDATVEPTPEPDPAPVQPKAEAQQTATVRQPEQQPQPVDPTQPPTINQKRDYSDPHKKHVETMYHVLSEAGIETGPAIKQECEQITMHEVNSPFDLTDIEIEKIMQTVGRKAKGK